MGERGFKQDELVVWSLKNLVVDGWVHGPLHFLSHKDIYVGLLESVEGR